MANPQSVETAFDLLAQALDRVSPARRVAFLSALSLALAARLDDAAALGEAIAMAEKASSHE